MKYIAFLSLFLLSLSCSTVPEETKEKENSTNLTGGDPILDFGLELSPEQETAFDALDNLQVSTDEVGLLYSTFPNLDQVFYPADTSFTISQAFLLKAMKQFLEKHGSLIDPEEREKLASESVMAQEEYFVWHSQIDTTGELYKDGLPLSGVWILPNILGHRDLILIW